MSKQKSKSKGQTLSLATFLSTEDDRSDSRHGSRGAYESRDRYDGGGELRNAEVRLCRQIAEHAGTPERRESREQLPIPTRPPFTAYVGNLSYEVSERDFHVFFGDNIRVKNVRLPLKEDGTSRGFGYVEFDDVESLIEAIKMDGESMMSRRVRINVAEEGKTRSGPRDEAFASNWRTAPRPEMPALAARQSWAPPVEPLGRPRSTLGPRVGEGEGAPAPAPKKPSANPFGEAKPRDENEIQRQVEERRKQREAEEAERRKREAEEAETRRRAEREAREKEAEARRSAPAVAPKKAPEPELPTSWRRRDGAPPPEHKGKPFFADRKPRGPGDKPVGEKSPVKDLAPRLLSAQPPKEDEKPATKTKNAFDLLGDQDD
ncbi:Eukaryotic translation initiation factor 4B [Polyrhizophydium stewartii]|uniref:Eukaryotic translation initiation factor 4B n=1 Tax=Polyrhizophydium stewartii TaxID=2732419 RepID=A0ABR4N488_9FUNG